MFRLIIADDEKEVREDMIACIDWAANGIEIVGTAEDGKAALDIIMREQPDLVLLDILMPGMTGIEVMQKAKESGAANTAFIVVSGCEEFSYARQAMNLGAVYYLLKPFMPDELLTALRKAIHDSDVPSMMRSDGIPALIKDLFDSSDATECPFYPARIEHELIGALLAEETEKSKRLADEFIKEIFSRNSTISQSFSCFLILYSSIYHALLHLGLYLSANPFSSPIQPNCTAESLVREGIHTVCREAAELLSSTESSVYTIKQVILYVNENYNSKLSLENLAEHVHVSPVYLSSLFSKTVGKTLMEYIQHVRIEKASILLKNPDLSLLDVAERVGYPDTKYFSQVFKKVTGITPSMYRNQINFGKVD